MKAIEQLNEADIAIDNTRVYCLSASAFAIEYGNEVRADLYHSRDEREWVSIPRTQIC